MYSKRKWESDRHFNFSYAQYLPKDFDENKKYPLVFFLHGVKHGAWNAAYQGDELYTWLLSHKLVKSDS